MRLTRTFFARIIPGLNDPPPLRGRHPQDPNRVRFRNPTLPMKLRRFVTGKTTQDRKETGMEELGLLFAALKANDFNEKYCQKEIDAVRKKNEDIKAQFIEKKRLIHSTEIKPGKDLHYLQLNRFLKKFPA